MRRREFIAGLGGAAVWSVAVPAQQPLSVIGMLFGGTEAEEFPPHISAAFRQGLREHGFAEGRNVEILYRWAETHYDRLPALAADLARRGVAVIVAAGGVAPVMAAKSATATIPIVFISAADPVELGLVASLNRPGGNVTGVSILTQAVASKRLQLLHEVVPAVSSIGYFVNPASPQVQAQIRDAEIAAGILGVRLAILNASTPGEIEGAFAILAEQRIGALMTAADPLFFVQRNQLAALTARYAVPAIYQVREMVDAGGLMSYGADLSDVYRLAASFAGRILKGEKPADLPVQQSTKIDLVINRKTAKALGLTIPETLLATADEVIQ
jgi:putative tryptophan/tyrosine transport system substrate-binding protein